MFELIWLGIQGLKHFELNDTTGQSQKLKAAWQHELTAIVPKIRKSIKFEADPDLFPGLFVEQTVMDLYLHSIQLRLANSRKPEKGQPDRQKSVLELCDKHPIATENIRVWLVNISKYFNRTDQQTTPPWPVYDSFKMTVIEHKWAEHQVLKGNFAICLKGHPYSTYGPKLGGFQHCPECGSGPAKEEEVPEEEETAEQVGEKEETVEQVTEKEETVEQPIFRNTGPSEHFIDFDDEPSFPLIEFD